MAAVSTISTMKVERPRARSSAAPTRENSRSTTPNARGLGRHEAAHLRQDGDQRVLAQEGGLAGHVRAGDEPQPRPSSEVAVVGDEGLAVRAASAASTTGWRPASTAKAGLSSITGPHVAGLCGELGERRGDVEGGHGGGGAGDRPRFGEDRLDELVQRRELERQRLVRGAGDAAVQLAQLDGGEAHRARHGLAVDEAAVGGLQQLLRLAAP